MRKRVNTLMEEGQKKARLLGKELDAALEDPRWLVDWA